VDPLAYRVAARYIAAGLQDTLTHKMEALFANFSEVAADEAADWFKDTFRFEASKTPAGQKALKEKASKFHWFLRSAAGFKGMGNTGMGWERAGKEAARIWQEEIKPAAADLVRYFTDEGGKVVPKEMKAGGNTYVNLIGFDEKKLGQYVAEIEKVFDTLKGWRRQALSGGVRVVFAGPKDFRGTAGGTYRSAVDELWIRATAGGRLERGGSGYGGLGYVIVHELGHRYDRKHGTKFDFERPEWFTSKYSHKDGEQFAELFAISNFDLKGDWNQAIIEKFNGLMG
jgi:hypothetical protein